MPLLGIDTGTATLGWAIAAWPGKPRLEEVGAEELEKEAGELVGEGLLRRLWLQGRNTLPSPLRVTGVVAEDLVFSNKGAAGTAPACLCWGMLIGWCMAHGLPLYRLRAQAWQRQILPGKGKVDQVKLGDRLEEHIARTPAAKSYAAIDPGVRIHARDAAGIVIVASLRPHLLERVSIDLALPA